MFTFGIGQDQSRDLPFSKVMVTRTNWSGLRGPRLSSCVTLSVPRILPDPAEHNAVINVSLRRKGLSVQGQTSRITDQGDFLAPHEIGR